MSGPLVSALGDAPRYNGVSGSGLGGGARRSWRAVRDCGDRFVSFVIRDSILGFNSFALGDNHGSPFFVGTKTCIANSRLGELKRCCTGTVRTGCKSSFSMLFKPTCGKVPLTIMATVTCRRLCNGRIHCYSSEGRTGSRNTSGKNFLKDGLGSNSEMIVVRSIAASNGSVRRAIPGMEKTTSIAVMNLVIDLGEVRIKRNNGIDTLSRVRRGCNFRNGTVIAVRRIARCLCGERRSNEMIVSSAVGTTVSRCCGRCNYG